jgi:alcohol dehydrogenase class IV
LYLQKKLYVCLSGNLHEAVFSCGNIVARENMLLGACLAGMAFTNAPVAGVHALAYPIGARFHVPHGLSNSLVLAPVMRFNLEVAHSMYSELGEIVTPNASGSSIERASQLVDYLAELPGVLGLPQHLRQVGIAESDLNQLADDAMLQTRLLMNSPKEITRQDAFEIYSEVL